MNISSRVSRNETTKAKAHLELHLANYDKDRKKGFKYINNN